MLVIYKLKKVKVLSSIILVIFSFLENRESFVINNSESTLVCLVYIDPLLVNITNSSDKGDKTEDSD